MMYFIASDHAGFGLKTFILEWFKARNLEIIDLGVKSCERVDYPDFAKILCQRVLESDANKGILVCGSGIGMSMSANRFEGIRAALCTSAYMAKMTRAHNDANVLCLGARVSGEGEVESMLEAFIQTPFEGGRHTCRIKKLDSVSKE
ncbi:ribose 5-phosphate isomerase B [Helicobacter fennelliae]